MITCPECCGVALRKMKGDLWKCEFCGTSFDFGKMRNALNMLVGRQFQEDFITELLDDARPRPLPALGERAWRWTGKHGTLNTLDAGNGWHTVMEASAKPRKLESIRSPTPSAY